MARLQDSEFDALFKQAAEEHRVQPSSSVWDRLERELDNSRGQRLLSYVWNLRIAASLTLLIGFGLAIYNDYDSIEIRESEKVDYEELAVELNLLPAVDESNLTEDELASLEEVALGTKKGSDPNTAPVAEAVTIPLEDDQAQLAQAADPSEQETEEALVAIPVTEDEAGSSTLQPVAVLASQESSIRSGGSIQLEEESNAPLHIAVRDFGIQKPAETPVSLKSRHNDKGIWVLSDEVFKRKPTRSRWFTSLTVSSIYTDASFSTFDFSQSYLYEGEENHILSTSHEVISSDVEYGASVQVIGGFHISEHVDISFGLDYRHLRGTQTARYAVEEQREVRVRREYPVLGPNNSGYDRIVVDEEEVQTTFRQDTLQSSFVYQSFEIPVRVRVGARTGKFGFYASTGASVAFGNSIQIDAESEKLPHVEENKLYYTALSPVEVSFLAGVGISYFVTPSFAFTVQPEFRFSSPTLNHTYLSRKYTSYQIGGGFYYYF